MDVLIEQWALILMVGEQSLAPIAARHMETNYTRLPNLVLEKAIYGPFGL